MEWPISRWIKVYEALQVATYATNPADIELGETAREIREEILAITPPIY